MKLQVFLTGCSTPCQRTAALQCCCVHSHLACYTTKTSERVLYADLGSLRCFAGVDGYDIGVHRFHSTPQCWHEGHFGKHVQSQEFGASLDADCDEVFQEVLQENLPATLNLLERATLK